MCKEVLNCINIYMVLWVYFLLMHSKCIPNYVVIHIFHFNFCVKRNDMSLRSDSAIMHSNVINSHQYPIYFVEWSRERDSFLMYCWCDPLFNCVLYLWSHDGHDISNMYVHHKIVLCYIIFFMFKYDIM